MDATGYKYVSLGLIFLRHISDAPEAKHISAEAIA
jgi:type I restriction-modification system DNA methylase subunit